MNKLYEDVTEYLDLILCDYEEKDFLTKDYSGQIIKDYISDHRCYDFVQATLAYGRASFSSEVPIWTLDTYLKHYIRLVNYINKHTRIKLLFDQLKHEKY